ncbi:MAG TPA: HD domain-containing phosphohydrolase [Gemmatimonadales bacterium]|nr:HD domain-containing phosphohydrolase [Gemmatimonadales bacterium]
MSDPLRFLTSLGQALSATGLYLPGHPARERAVDSAWEQLEALQKLDPAPTFSFLEDEVLYRQQALRDFKAWDWARRLSRAGVQRVEFDREVSREELSEFLAEVHRKVSSGTPDDTSEARQLHRPSIRFGMVSIRGASADIAVEVAESTTVPYTLDDEIEAVTWIHAEVETSDSLPLAEANAVVRSLSMAMHSQSRMLMPLLQLKSYDQYTTTHATNVSVLAMALAEYIGLSPKDVREFGVAGLLHDLGKVRVPKEILVKPGALSAQEVAVLRKHPVDGARLILARERNLDLAATVAYEHHIMINGQGYPRFRYQRETHFASRLVHLCDVFDALCTARPYRDAWATEMALAYIEERAGSDFEPQLAESFTAMMRLWTHQRLAVPLGGSPAAPVSLWSPSPAATPAPAPPPPPPQAAASPPPAAPTGHADMPSGETQVGDVQGGQGS